MGRRQPEVGSALGHTTDQTVARCDRRLDWLAGVREKLTSELAVAVGEHSDGTPPVDIARRLHETTGRMM